jgi:hypothetical protein
VSNEAANSPLVVQFMTAFNKLKDWSDDDPRGLAELASNDESICDLCTHLYDCAVELRDAELASTQAFTSSTNQAFRSAFRDFEERYEQALMWIALAQSRKTGQPVRFASASLPHDVQGEFAKYIGSRRSVSMQGLMIAVKIHEAELNQTLEKLRGRSDDEPPIVEDALETWDQLETSVGLDLQGAFRRRELLPFTLPSQMLSGKNYDSKIMSLLGNLEDAQRAFVFGAMRAAVGLMRSTMEATLRDHYGAKGKGLSDYINDTASRLPPAANKDRLHNLRLLANAILHLNPDVHEGSKKWDEVRLESEIVSFMKALRALIEGAK